MEYKALRVFNPRTANKVIIFILAITSLYITWTVHYTVRNTWPLLEIHRENEIRDFNQQWCRMHRWRVDWEDMVKPCRRQEAWELRQVNSEWRTDASRSFIKKWEIQPAGQFSRFFIQSVTKDGFIKKIGGDAWRVYIRQGPASLAPQIWDLDNGQYEVVFLAMEPGDYSAQITLDFTLCDGLRDPPKDWFIKGTIHGKYQPDGMLGYIGDDYMIEPLGGQTTFMFSIPQSGATTTGVTAGQVLPCGITCNLLQDGFGRWVNGLWLPYVENYTSATISETSVTPAETLWIYGDSVGQRFLKSLKQRGICRRHFKECKTSYMWIYELTNVEMAKSRFEPNDYNETIVLQHMADVLDSPEMQTPNSVFLFNLGVHYSVSLNFTAYKNLIDNVVNLIKRKISDRSKHLAIPVWKTTTSIEREKTHKMYAELPKNVTHWRFHTHQRLELFHKFAVSAMCKAGIPVLDVYPMTFSYPNGTLDHVHYDDRAQRAAEDQLLKFIEERPK